MLIRTSAPYGLRQGVLMVPARFGQASAPFLFAPLMERYGTAALLLSTALGIAQPSLLSLPRLDTHETANIA